ncbi:DUF1328 domain-containing protein [Olleya marilimosa]|uniref:DUF1328 domain-containing protein n=2 Tax=Olleya marilimosa TaxID=272164 RepID=A0ABR8LSY6_9FLAO|nr:DUF1328 domain-containing protein [Olleya marilimosa]MBD3889971.1 DUF1328 domain-containing protein [Olleya marilimosa]
MMRWTIFFIILAFISAILGFGDIAGNLAFLAKLCFFVFVALFIGTVYKFISEH